MYRPVSELFAVRATGFNVSELVAISVGLPKASLREIALSATIKSIPFLIVERWRVALTCRTSKKQFKADLSARPLL